MSIKDKLQINTTDNIDFSIIVTTYNRHELLKDCLKSFLSQSYCNFELIVIDRGSYPSVEDIVSQFNDNRISYVKSSQDEHFCDIGNKVVAKSKGKYLCVFGDDDVVLPETLELVKKAFDKYSDCDIVTCGSVSVCNNNFPNSICIPSDFSGYKRFNYFHKETPLFKLSGKEYLKWIMSEQYIGEKIECNFPSYIHPSTMFIRKSEIYYNVVKLQHGIMVKPSFDSGYLSVAYYTNILYLNIPLIIVRRGNNVSVAPRRFWNKETEDIKYQPKIAHLENRGTDSILNVLHLNNLNDEFDTTIQFALWKKILKDLKNDSIWDKQTFTDFLSLIPYYFSSKKNKIYLLFSFIQAILSGFIKRLKIKKKKLNNNQICCVNCSSVADAVDKIYNDQITNISKVLSYECKRR